MQKSDETEDLRVRRTRKLLQQAMIELTVEKGFADISIRDITERAMVNRSTFYRHYLDKCDLMAQYMEEVYALTSDDEIEAEKTGQVSHESSSGLVKLLNHIREFSAFYRVMLGAKGDPGFTEGMRQNAENRFRNLLARVTPRTDPTLPPLDMRVSYVSSAVMGAIIWWLQNDMPCSTEQLAKWIGGLSSVSVGLVPKKE